MKTGNNNPNIQKIHTLLNGIRKFRSKKRGGQSTKGILSSFNPKAKGVIKRMRMV